MRYPDAYVVIPAWNEVATISDVVTGALQYANVVVVSDASSDGTDDAAKKAGAIVYRNEVNLGYEGSLDKGFAIATESGARVVVTMDADGQMSSEDLPVMISPILSGAVEMVIGRRQRASRISEFCVNLYTRGFHGVEDMLCGMKAYDTALYRRFGFFDRSKGVNTELVFAAVRKGVPFVNCPVSILPRRGAPRFGSIWRANMRIFRVLIREIGNDVRRFFHIEP